MLNNSDYYFIIIIITLFRERGVTGPTYMNLVRHFWVKAQVYDHKAAQLEMDEKVLIDPSLAGKSRE